MHEGEGVSRMLWTQPVYPAMAWPCPRRVVPPDVFPDRRSGLRKAGLRCVPELQR